MENSKKIDLSDFYGKLGNGFSFCMPRHRDCKNIKITKETRTPVESNYVTVYRYHSNTPYIYRTAKVQPYQKTGNLFKMVDFIKF